MDDVNQKSQALLEANSDARISHTITQLTTKYQSLLALSKEIVRKLEVQCSEHANYNEAAEAFSVWLDASTEKLQTQHNSTGTKSDIEERIAKLRVSYGIGQCNH